MRGNRAFRRVEQTVRTIAWLALAGAMGTAQASRADAPAGPASPASEWRQFNGTLDGERYSLLTQINTENAATLSEVCRVEVSHHGSFQTGPLVIDGTMYVTAEADTVALDPSNCTIRWRHTYRSEQAGYFAVNRGAAYLNGRVFRGTDDARVIALDAATGRELWRSVAGDGRLGEFISSAPIAWNGLVIVGVAASDFGIKGRVLAFDAATGREVWRFNTIPTGAERGADSWRDTHWAEHGGGGTWSSFALDPETDEVFIPVGNPAPDFAPGDRPGANLFTDSVVALDARTGALNWWYQLSPHDSHDWDLGAAPMLYRNAQDRDVVAAAGKDGYLHVIDRLSHELIFKVPTTTVDANPASPTAAGARVCPGTFGGTEWNGPAYDPAHKLVFTGAVDMCQILITRPGEGYQTGRLAYGGAWQITADPPTGWISAFDANTGKLRWKYHTGAAMVAALTPTAGGILLSGDNSGNLFVFESATGKLLKTIETRGSISGGIVAYEINGREYIALTSGNVSRTGFAAIGRPSIVVMQADLPPKLSGPKPPDAARGGALYLRTCGACHGPDGNGVYGFSLAHIKARMNTLKLIAWIKNPAPPMPKVFPEPLEEDDIETINDIAAYLEEH